MSRRLIRPLWVVGITWAAVCLIGAWVSVTALCAAGAVGLLCVVLALCIPLLRRWHSLVLCLVTVVLAIGVLLYWQTVRYLPTLEKDGQEVHLRARVQENDEFIELRVLSGDLPAGTRLQLYSVPLGMALDPNDTVDASFVLKANTSDELSMLVQKSRGVWLSVEPTDLSGEKWHTTKGDTDDVSVMKSLRREISLRIQTLLSSDVGAVVTGICLGADERLSYEATADFRACGVSHLFAVSGLHLSILIQALLWALKRLHLSRRLRGVICAAAVIGFSALVGWTPSVVRAGVMCLTVVLGDCARRQADARNSLGLALVILLAADPFAVYDPALLLSFSATFGLLFLSPSIRQTLLKVSMHEKLKPLWNGVSATVAVTVAATLATLPTTVLYFGTVSLVGVLANLVMTLPASLLLIVGWMAIVAMLLGLSFVYYPLLMLVGYVARFLLGIADAIAALPFATVTITDTYLVIGVLGSLAVVGVGWLLLKGRGVRLAALLCAVVLCIGSTLYQYRLRDYVRFLMVPHQADLAVCMVYRGRAVLFIAPTEAHTVYAVSDALRSEGITTLDAVFLPSDEWDGIPYVSQLLSRYVDSTQIYRGFDGKTVLSDGVWAEWNESRLYWQCDGITAVFAPDGGSFADDADVVFCNTQAVNTVTESVVVVQNAKSFYAIPPHGVAVSGNENVWIWVDRTGEVRIK